MKPFYSMQKNPDRNACCSVARDKSLTSIVLKYVYPQDNTVPPKRTRGNKNKRTNFIFYFY